MPFQKGKSGNPKGRPKDKAFTDALRLAVNRTDGDGRKKLAVLAEKAVEYAMAGESWAMQMIADRIEGKVAQVIEATHYTGDAADLSDNELAIIASGRGDRTAETQDDPPVTH